MHTQAEPAEAQSLKNNLWGNLKVSFVLGIAGTAKNTGKTTTTAAILRALYDKNISIGLTSIGYDGEEIDNITGLPKPRFLLKTGLIVAIAETCIKVSKAKFKIIKSTNIMTPLGRILIAKVIEGGMVVIAGPNKSIELKTVLDFLKQKLGCELIIVDGALNRIAPMKETDAIILATGAARNTNIDALAYETKAICKLFNINEANSREKNLVLNHDKITIISQNIREPFTLKYSSLLDETTVIQILSKIDDAKIIYIPGMIPHTMFRKLNNMVKNHWQNKSLLIGDVFKLLAGGEALEIIKQINAVYRNNGDVKVTKKISLLAVTVNPFYPLFRFDKNKYEEGFVNSHVLLKKMKACIEIPVIDVKNQGPSVITDILYRKIKDN